MALTDLLTQTAARYGLDPATFIAIAQIESGLNPAAQNPNSSAGGLYQFIDSTWGQYGSGDKMDPAANADAAGRYLTDVRNHLRGVLGREPTAGELYLGHQQGAGGAAKLLSNPTAPAVSIVGPSAVRLNAGAPGMTAADFAGLWDRKISGVLGAPTPEAPAMPAPPEWAQQFPSSGPEPVATAAAEEPAGIFDMLGGEQFGGIFSGLGGGEETGPQAGQASQQAAAQAMARLAQASQSGGGLLALLSNYR